MKPKIATSIAGHIAAEPRLFELRSGAGCELRITVARPEQDDNGVPFNRDRKVKAVTYDTRLAQILASEYKAGDFVQIVADDVRVERAWKTRQGDWVSGSAVFPITRIRKVDALTPDPDHPAASSADGRPAAENAAARAEASVLDGVRVTGRGEQDPAEAELAAATA